MPTRLAAVLVLLAVPLFAQVPAASEHIQVTVVEVPVNVVDRSGEAVRNLKLENFELFDNGQRRAITHFDAIDLSGGTKIEAGGPEAAAASRNFLLLFDLNGSRPGTLARARQAARNFVKSAGVANDRIAVGTFAMESGFHLLTSFTTDMHLVSAAIDSLGAPKMFQPVDPLLLSSLEMHQLADEAEASTTKNGALLAEDLRETTRMIDRANNDVQRQFINRTIDGYAELARTLDRVAGRKQVILLTEGFDAKLLHGRESLTSSQAKEEQRQIERGEYWRVDTDNRFGSSEAANGLQDMIKACRRSDVVLHAIDIKGLRGPTEVGDEPVGSNESLFLITHDTGGMVFKNANSLDEDFQRLLRAEQVVYILGFEAPSGSTGKFHELKVKLVNVSSARALHRAGYVELGPATNPVERTLTASEIVVNQLPVSDIRVHALVTPFPRRDAPAQVPVIVEIDGRSLLRAVKGNQIQSEVFIYAFDDSDNIRDFVHQPIALDVTKLRDRLQKNGVRLYQTLLLPPGHYSIRTLVRTVGQSLYGFNSTLIDVPAYGQSTVLGGSAFDDNPTEWVPVKPPDRAGVPHEYPFTIDGAMLVPAAAPVLRSGVSSHVGLFVDHLSAESVAAAINGQNTPLKVAARTSQADGTTKLLLDFTPPPLPPGDYVLTLRVPGAIARNVAEVRFAIR